MVFYGTKGAHLKTEKVTNIKCNHCKEQTSHTVSIFGRYAYIYWIPIFPLAKKGVAECDSCKVTVEPKQMSDQLRLKYDNVNRDTKTPITYWIGALIIALAIAYGIYASNQHKKDVAEYIANPQKGDVVEYKPTDFYSTLKVVAVTNDSIFLVTNNYEIGKQTRLYKIDKKENYNEEAYGISRQTYEDNFKNNVFLDLDR